jgi:hypothetical protein
VAVASPRGDDTLIRVWDWRVGKVNRTIRGTWDQAKKERSWAQRTKIGDHTSLLDQLRLFLSHLGTTPLSPNEHIQGVRGAAWKAFGRKVFSAARGVRADFDGFRILRVARTPHFYGIEVEHPNLRSAVRVTSSLRKLFERALLARRT